MNNMKNEILEKKKHIGFTLLWVIIIISIVLSISFTALMLTMGEMEFSIVGRESQKALYAANSGIECALYWEFQKSAFDSWSNPPSTPAEFSPALNCADLSGFNIWTNGVNTNYTCETGEDYCGAGNSTTASSTSFALKLNDNDACVEVSVFKILDQQDSLIKTKVLSVGFSQGRAQDSADDNDDFNDYCQTPDRVVQRRLLFRE
jgi:hypothetical protein